MEAVRVLDGVGDCLRLDTHNTHARPLLSQTRGLIWHLWVGGFEGGRGGGCVRDKGAKRLVDNEGPPVGNRGEEEMSIKSQSETRGWWEGVDQTHTHTPQNGKGEYRGPLQRYNSS